MVRIETQQWMIAFLLTGSEDLGNACTSYKHLEEAVQAAIRICIQEKQRLCMQLDRWPRGININLKKIYI